MISLEDIKKDANDALKRIYLSERQKCIKYLMKNYSLTEDESLEIFQDSIVIMMHNIRSGRLVELNSNIGTYLTGIAINKAREWKRANKRDRSLIADYFQLNHREVSKEVHEIQNQQIEQSYHALSILGDPCKSLLIDFYTNGLSMNELATRYNYNNTSTAKNSKYKCLKRLQKIFHNIKNKQE